MGARVLAAIALCVAGCVGGPGGLGAHEYARNLEAQPRIVWLYGTLGKESFEVPAGTTVELVPGLDIGTVHDAIGLSETCAFLVRYTWTEDVDRFVDGGAFVFSHGAGEWGATNPVSAGAPAQRSARCPAPSLEIVSDRSWSSG